MLRHSTIVLEWPVQQRQCSIITYSFRICTNFLINSSNLPGSYEVILGANENPEQPFKELNVVYQMMWFNSLSFVITVEPPYNHREEIYREETRGKLCHADILSLLTIENYINSLFY
jgi:hypothetical protein